jgi:hypothetical protein
MEAYEQLNTASKEKADRIANEGFFSLRNIMRLFMGLMSGNPFAAIFQIYTEIQDQNKTAAEERVRGANALLVGEQRRGAMVEALSKSRGLMSPQQKADSHQRMVEGQGQAQLTDFVQRDRVALQKLESMKTILQEAQQMKKHGLDSQKAILEKISAMREVVKNYRDENRNDLPLRSHFDTEAEFNAAKKKAYLNDLVANEAADIMRAAMKSLNTDGEVDPALMQRLAKLTGK